ncbi:hypothetical protein C8R45DRAFT_1116131 [Mycena sanguinolenta]|nr:hypothetical protein C8R45DRAFT_1116131 [Mycena sanguinolenta]
MTARKKAYRAFVVSTNALALFGVNTENIYKEADEHVNPHVSSPQSRRRAGGSDSLSSPTDRTPAPNSDRNFYSVYRLHSVLAQPKGGGAVAPRQEKKLAVKGFTVSTRGNSPRAQLVRLPSLVSRPPSGGRADPLLIARWGALASTPGRIFRHPTQAWVIPGAGSQPSCSLVVGPGLKTFGSN